MLDTRLMHCKFLFISFVFLSFGNSELVDLNVMRVEFHTLNSDKELQMFAEAYRDNLIGRPYAASAIMQRAEHTFFPHKKLSYFNEGKEMLDSYIAFHPDNVEARYVRYLTQKNVPKFLGYYSKTEEDLQVFYGKLDLSNLPESYKIKMIETIEEIKLCN